MNRNNEAVRPKKFLGQHFLTDLSIAQRIADTVDACPGLPVLEVGPGMGVLTQFLMKKERPLKVVEIDRESVPYLKEHFPALADSVVEADFLAMDLTALFDGMPFVLTGNYPYNISSQIFFKMLENNSLLHRHDSDGGGRAACSSTRQQDLRRAQCAGAGMVRR